MFSVNKNAGLLFFNHSPVTEKMKFISKIKHISNYLKITNIKNTKEYVKKVFLYIVHSKIWIFHPQTYRSQKLQHHEK